MIQHFLVVGAALLISFWSTVVHQYHEFQGPEVNSTPFSEVASSDSTDTGAVTPTPFETVVSQIVNASSTPPASTSAPESVDTVPLGPVSETPPSVPFTPLPVPEVPVVIPDTPTSPPLTTNVDAELSDEALLKGAVVNIICLPGGGLHGSSGSGVVVDPRGIILTVAHIGQNFLLTDYPTEDAGSCYIRTGSPARNAYSAQLIYISPSWVKENQTTFLQSRPRGTGEHDFAFIAITGSITSASLPRTFSYIPIAPANTKIKTGDRVGTGSYAAEFLTSSEVRSSLYPTIKFADIDDALTFSSGSVDIFSVAAGSAAQEGSSGGAVINSDDRLIGLITTRTGKSDLSLRSLQAITMDHLRQSFKEDTDENLDSYLKDSIPLLIRKFEGTAVELQDILFEAIDEASN